MRINLFVPLVFCVLLGAYADASFGVDIMSNTGSRASDAILDASAAVKTEPSRVGPVFVYRIFDPYERAEISRAMTE